MKKLLFVLLSMLLSITSVHANSAQKYWHGQDRLGVLLKDESPIVATHEDLIFNIKQFPEPYATAKHLDDYDASVQAIYTFKNNSDAIVDATLVFPFGTYPTYLDEENINDTNKYDILNKDEKVNYTLRYTYSQDFKKEDLDLLLDDYKEDKFYHRDTPVYHYSLLSDEDVLIPCRSDEEIRIYSPHMYGFDGENMMFAPHDKRIDIYYIGKDREDDFKHLKHTKIEMSFENFVFSFCPEDSNILKHDWYNAFIDYWNINHNNIMMESILSKEDLMRWYEYDLHFEPNQEIINTVNAPMYPIIDKSNEMPIYTYTYLLTPASTWKDFKDLDITINTPYTIESDHQFKQTEEGYTLSYETLPEDELVFTLFDGTIKEETTLRNSLIMCLAVIVALALLIILKNNQK